MMSWGQLSFQDASSMIMLQLTSLHDYALMILTLVLTMVGYGLFSLTNNKLMNRYIHEAQSVEVFWTVAPAIILLSLALPSLRLLYMMDEVSSPMFTIKVIGHQWYWSYEYTDFSSIEMDSYMVPSSDLKMGDYRLLEVDNRIAVPMRLEIRLLITAADVIHSWTIPALAVKVDAVPGRLNQLAFIITNPGVFYGQCSEICGANHSFMPIAVESINTNSFIKWILNFNL
uniref:cytochrome c oxidase subunit II n=1 Tax=Drawida ghilarovi TaxID=994964 RepID=UPI0021B631B3|nr:cytochrome c oxidase subunit II [Drawida ghilarovi]UIX22927.1 cytochrome c oxidase subunit II [Drawida ghilarovi]UIX22940.1 cytochrome c oxidase subunit II [Drawida ghilarovi]